MKVSATRLGRALTQLAIRQAISASAPLSIEQKRRAVHSLVGLAGAFPMLRRRVRENMGLALGSDVPINAESLYFRRLDWLLGNALSAFHHGIEATPILDEIRFDETVELLDHAFSQRRGVVVVSPHWSGHEFAAAALNRRHPVTLLVRQAPTEERTKRKLQWYDALGTEIVLRPIAASAIKDAVTYLRILKQGKALCISPDLLADSGQGVEVRIFGRPARLHGGAFAIALAARSPMLRFSLSWQSDSSAVGHWEDVALSGDDRDRVSAVRTAAQDWCIWFEDKLRANPENWLFWLDKRWSRFLRTTPNVSGTA